MEYEVIELILVLFKWAGACFGIGLVFTIALINILRGLGIEFTKIKVTTCWIYLTLFVFGLCILLELFA